MTERTVNIVRLLLHIATFCIIFSVGIIIYKVTEPVPEIPEQVQEPRTIPKIIPDIKPSKKKEEPEQFTAELEEHSEYTAVFYATEPIGRYYITGYNHLETGSKQTASGAICHEGTITTCAADPRYHKFGEYLEIGGRIYRVEDTGSAVKKKHIDIYFAKYGDMVKYGSHYETIYKVTFPFGKPKD